MVDKLGQREVGLQGQVSFILWHRRHEPFASRPHILLERDEVVALFLQGLYDAWQGCYGGLARHSARVMQQDDVPITMVHAVDDALVYGFGRYAGLPVVGVYRLAHEEIVAPAGQYHRLNLLGLRRIGIGIIGRAEQ